MKTPTPSFLNNDDDVVYVIEDDEQVRDALGSLIRSAGHRVATFAAPEDYLSRHRRGSGGCLVLDVWLPGMSGLELQAALRSAGSDLPVIFISGQGARTETARCHRASAAVEPACTTARQGAGSIALTLRHVDRTRKASAGRYRRRQT